MKSKKIAEIALILIAYAFSLSIFACALNDLIKTPETVNVSKTIAIGNELTFKEADILSSVDNISKIDGIILCSLPDSSLGTLKFGTRDLLCGEAVTTEGIRGLKFIPSTSASGKTFFSFIPVYRSGKTDKVVNISVNVLKELNHSPTVKDIHIKTARNIAINGVFHGSDPEVDELTYSVTQQPKLGNVEICLDAKNKFLYTPYQNKTGKDSFKYVAMDKHGNTSSEGTVTVEIERSKVKLTYADMEGNGLHYQAIALAENGIYKGETIGVQNFLRPTLPVTRSEFISMAMALCEKRENASAVSQTVFADDNAIPAWAKPTVHAAVNNGLISGSIVGNNCYLRPNDIITRSEAAVILDNLISSETLEDTTHTFADASLVPVWAQKATKKLASLNIMSQFSDSTIRPTTQLTRQDAIELIYNAMRAIE